MHAVCESFISYLSVVKSGCRNRLNERNLTDLMRNKVTGPTLHVFRERFCELAVDLWNIVINHGGRPKGTESNMLQEETHKKGQEGRIPKRLVERHWSCGRKGIGE